MPRSKARPLWKYYRSPVAVSADSNQSRLPPICVPCPLFSDPLSTSFQQIFAILRCEQNCLRKPPTAIDAVGPQAETMRADESDSFDSICTPMYPAGLSWRLANDRTDYEGGTILTDTRPHNLRDTLSTTRYSWNNVDDQSTNVHLDFSNSWSWK
jgi:hypothetical protein